MTDTAEVLTKESVLPEAAQQRILSNLDELWEKYLDLLDQYRTSQAELAGHLSSVCWWF